MRLLDRNRTRTAIPIALLFGIFTVLSGTVAQASSDDGNDTHSLVCPNSITGGIYIAGCLPSVNPPASKVNNRGTDQVATLYGIPCTGQNIGKCLGLSRIQP